MPTGGLGPVSVCARTDVVTADSHPRLSTMTPLMRSDSARSQGCRRVPRFVCPLTPLPASLWSTCGICPSPTGSVRRCAATPCPAIQGSMCGRLSLTGSVCRCIATPAPVVWPPPGMAGRTPSRTGRFVLCALTPCPWLPLSHMSGRLSWGTLTRWADTPEDPDVRFPAISGRRSGAASLR